MADRAERPQRAVGGWLVGIAALALALVGAGASYYHGQAAAFRAQAERRLSSIAELKVDELSTWYRERLSDARFFQNSQALAQLVARYLAAPGDEAIAGELRVWFSDTQGSHGYGVFLTDGAGVVRLSLPATQPPMDRALEGRVRRVLEVEEMRTADFYVADAGDRAYLGAVMPLRTPGDPARVQGTLVWRLDPASFVYPLLERWPTTTTTAELLLVRRDGDQVVFLYPGRLDAGGPLGHRQSVEETSVPAVQAVLGTRGTVEGRDSRGVPVLAAAVAVPNTDWVLLAQESQAEVFAPLRARLWTTTALAGALLVAAASTVGLLWRQQAADHYRRLFHAEAEVRANVEALRHADQVLRFHVENSPLAMIEWDTSFRITGWSVRAEAIFGWSADEVVGKHPSEWPFVHPDDVERTNDTRRELLSGDVPRSASRSRNLTRDGRVLCCEWYHSIRLDAAGGPSSILSLVHDVTDRRENERRIREQASLLDKAQDAIIVCDLDQRITYWNRSAERLYGWAAEDALGRLLRPLVYRDDDRFAQAMDVLLATGEWMGELQQVDRDGQALVVEGRWTLVTDDGGQPQTILVFNADVSERRRLESQFLRAQRLESLGTLAGGIAHDLNNVLSPILLSIDLLRLGETDPERLALLSTVQASAQRGADMVTQVLSFARGVGGRRIEVAPGPLIHEIQTFACETFPKSIDVRTSVPADLRSVSGDPTQLHQVLLNLCVNARDAMTDGGTLTLTASNVVLDEHDAAREDGVAAGPYVVIDVADSGTGIASGVMDRMFEPFFTTKELGRGTGLGLFTSLAIVNGHGGFMRVTSDVGTGSTFRVYLPASAAGGLDTSTSDTRDLPRGHRELVLVIDDELAVREVTRRTLEAFGYRVLTAGDGAEGMIVFNERREDVAVVLIDMMMPVMDGSATIQALREARSDIPVVAASGIAPHSAPEGGSMPDVALFLQKPYSADTLLTSLAHVLRGEPGPPLT